MSRRVTRVNELIQRVFAEILLKEADLPRDVLVTVTRVDTAPNLARTTIWLSVHPDTESEAILETLTAQIYDLQGAFNRELDLKPLPRIRLRIDYGAAHAQHISEIAARLAEEEGDDDTTA